LLSRDGAAPVAWPGVHGSLADVLNFDVGVEFGVPTVGEGVTYVKSVPVAEDLFTWPSEDPRLIGMRCDSCATLSFPVSTGCPRCGSDLLTWEQLESEGSLWSWTSQEFLPKAPYLGAATPETFEPWFVGVVELGGAIRVEGRLVDVDRETISIGQRMRTVVVPFASDDDGRDVLTFAFAPVLTGGSDEGDENHG
jgi:uncharacterized OB-fold protein